jgi:hypothetical protein
VHLAGLDRLYWLAGFGAHAVLFSILLSRRFFRQFPCFTLFVAFNISRTIALFVIESRGTRHQYFESYWALGAVDTILELALVSETYIRTFRPLGQWPRDLEKTVLKIALCSAAIASGLTLLAAPRTRLWTQAIVIRGTFFSSTFMSELFVAMITLSVRVGLPWHSYVQKISQGLGVYSIIDFLIEAGHNIFGVGTDTHLYTELSQLRMTAYLLCLFYWIWALSRNTPARGKIPQKIYNQLVELERIAGEELGEVRARWEI